MVFDTGREPDDGAAHVALADVLAERLRCTDDAGWFDRTRVAAVLPDTALDGAWLLADDVRQRGRVWVPKLACAVYAYPPAWWHESPDDTEAGRQPPATGSGDRPAPPAHTPREWRAVSTAPEDRDELQTLLGGPLPRWKRAVDLVVAGVGLLLLSPVMATAALAVKLSSPGPIIFRQLRVGRDGRPFVFYKFRTMAAESSSRQASLRPYNEQTGPVFKMRSDPRVTRVGRLLRKTSVDELPQLWNVLRGEMSLVGPRPPTLDEVQEYERWHHRRLNLTPGLTCIWQVSGRSLVGFTDWVRMDIEYAERRSFLLDLRILVRTIPAVLSGRGAH